MTAGSLPPTRSGAGPIAAIRVLTGRSFRRDLRDVEALLMAVILPVMLMLLFTFVFGGAIAPAGGYIDFVIPGIIVTCVGFGAASTAVSVSQDMTTGVINRFRTMPFPSGAVLVGHTLSSLARNLAATAVVVGVGLSVGFRPEASPAQWVAIVGVVAAYILAITSVFALIGLVSGSPQAASGYGFVLLFLPYVSSAFAPIETMPLWLQGFARNQPLNPLIDAIRALLSGAPPGADAVVGVAWSAGIAAVAIALIFRVFPRSAVV